MACEYGGGPQHAATNGAQALAQQIPQPTDFTIGSARFSEPSRLSVLLDFCMSITPSPDHSVDIPGTARPVMNRSTAGHPPPDSSRSETNLVVRAARRPDPPVSVLFIGAVTTNVPGRHAADLELTLNRLTSRAFYS